MRSLASKRSARQRESTSPRLVHQAIRSILIRRGRSRCAESVRVVLSSGSFAVAWASCAVFLILSPPDPEKQTVLGPGASFPSTRCSFGLGRSLAARGRRRQR